MASSLASTSWVVLPPVQARVAAAVAVGPTCRVLLAYTPLLSGSARRRVVGRPLAPPRCSALEDPGPSDGGEGNGRVGEEGEGGVGGGVGGGEEEGAASPAAAAAAGVETDLVRLQEDPQHHHPQCPHRHLRYAMHVESLISS